MSKKAYAFWRYDNFPFVLGGETTGDKLNKDGKIYVNNYSGYIQPDVAVVSFEKGQQVKEKLNILTKRRLDALKKVEDTFKKELDVVMNDLTN